MRFSENLEESSKLLNLFVKYNQRMCNTCNNFIINCANEQIERLNEIKFKIKIISENLILRGYAKHLRLQIFLSASCVFHSGFSL